MKRLSVLLFLMVGGCAATGSLMEVAGTMTGQKSLSAAGASFKRVDEVQDFTEEEKSYTGRSVAANLLAGSELSSNTGLEHYVGKLGQTLAQASGLETPQGWHFVLLKSPQADAFAAPGGIILLTEGLVKLCQSEDELAGVLAHEVAHVSLDHPMQAISQANRKNALVSLAGAAYGMATKDRSDLQALSSQFNSVVGDVGKAVGQGYDRDKEKEADLAAVDMLRDLGYDPSGLARVLSRLSAGDHSHGDPKARAKAVDEAAQESPAALPARTTRFKKALSL